MQFFTPRNTCLGRRLSFALSFLGFATALHAHGALEFPVSRVYNCYLTQNASPACADAVALGGAQAVYDWNGVNIGDASGQHQLRSPGGKLCSAGRDQHKGFDLARRDWPATSMQSGSDTTLVFHATAPHATAYFRFYITRDGFDPTSPLTWTGLEAAPFCETVPTLQNGRYRMPCRLPKKTGRHIVYMIWQRSDSPEAFYSCSDVDFGGGAPPPPAQWFEVGRIRAAQSLPAGTAVTVRIFDATGRDVETHRLLLRAEDTSAQDWPRAAAEYVNSKSALVRAGELGANGTVAPVRSASENFIYSRLNIYQAAVDIRTPGTPVPEPTSSHPLYPAGHGSYGPGSLVRGADGATYQCRPFPNSGWCNGWDLYYAPGTGLSWPEAWVRVEPGVCKN
ncbi:MAG: lytic polysaccharide monooxygenase [Bryobacterales bacterium]|nr:lytic polysaccharide monooxygenase [Bryobacterales bacterium]